MATSAHTAWHQALLQELRCGADAEGKDPCAAANANEPAHTAGHESCGFLQARALRAVHDCDLVPSQSMDEDRDNQED